MYDLHTHILPGLDDGAKTMSEALEMARIAAGDGSAVLLATPHSADLASFTHQEIVERVAELQQRLDQEGIGLKIVLGMENHISPDLPRLAEEGQAYTVNDTSYILVELDFNLYPIYTEQVLFELQLNGLRPIIAHPERYAYVQRDIGILEKLVGRGMLTQITGTSLTGDFGAKAKHCSVELLERNLAHLIASDTHASVGHRTPLLTPGVAAAAKVVGKARARAMVTFTPQAILEGKPLGMKEPSLPSKKGWKFWE